MSKQYMALALFMRRTVISEKRTDASFMMVARQQSGCFAVKSGEDRAE